MEAIAGAGADAIEIGIPFSDPMIDGPVIQAASLRALGRGPRPRLLADLGRLEIGIPLVVMTYYNLMFRAGHQRFAGLMAECGRVRRHHSRPFPRGARTLGPGGRRRRDCHCVAGGARPTPDRPGRGRCAARSRGFVYGVGRMGVTGERRRWRGSARGVAGRIPAVTDLPVCIGIGVSTPEQAVTVCEVADGVVVGSALVRRLLEGEGPDGAAEFVSSLRRALDGG